MGEQMQVTDRASATVTRKGGVSDECNVIGTYHVVCVGADGKEKWRDTAPNTVTTAGKTALLDIALAGSTCTVVTFLGLISSVSYTGIAPADTMASHGGWKEAGPTYAPSYTVAGNARRGVPTWAAAGGSPVVTKAMSANISYVITQAAGGTLKGCFMVIGTSAGTPSLTGASYTLDQATGTLLSAGTFSQDKLVSQDDTVNVSYQLQMT